jgi:ferrous iron transport protein B
LEALRKPARVALIGNPNSGKTSLFNFITGLQQKVGNFPGVTVDIKSADTLLPDNWPVSWVDFPGLYNLYPTSRDEKMVVQSLLDTNDRFHPDLICYVADVTNLEKHLLLLNQLKDMGFPLILVLNMIDLAQKEDLVIDASLLSKQLNVPVVTVSGRSGAGIPDLFKAIKNRLSDNNHALAPDPGTYHFSDEEAHLTQHLETIFPSFSAYKRLLMAHHAHWLPFISVSERIHLLSILGEHSFKSLPFQVREVTQRYHFFTPIVARVIKKKAKDGFTFSEKLDGLLTNRIFGLVVFLGILTFLFQSLYSWAEWPMTLIEEGFSSLGNYLTTHLPEGWFTQFLTEGLLAGLGGILVFIPQIALLFFLISILEEIGYMSRAAFLFDRIMQIFGLNGRSMVALISGGACAIPAIMSTRTIASWKERLITILITPFISCSARIPVYTVLIGLVIPPKNVGYIFNVQGLAFLGLYLAGIFAALLSGLLLKWWIKSDEPSFLLLALPDYKLPVWRNVGLTVWEKVRTFTLEAGKIILIISIALWFLANNGPKAAMTAAGIEAKREAVERKLSEEEAANLTKAYLLETSYAGLLGKSIEPVIRPLGFDWKIGIALFTSFAAREVFVGTMATIYSLGQNDDALTLRERLAVEKNPETGKPRYDLATGISLLLFYVFAMQCMSTLAVVKRETKSWKWPIIQFLGMTFIAYISSFIAFQLLQ